MRLTWRTWRNGSDLPRRRLDVVHPEGAALGATGAGRCRAGVETGDGLAAEQRGERGVADVLRGRGRCAWGAWPTRPGWRLLERPGVPRYRRRNPKRRRRCFVSVQESPTKLRRNAPSAFGFRGPSLSSPTGVPASGPPHDAGRRFGRVAAPHVPGRCGAASKPTSTGWGREFARRSRPPAGPACRSVPPAPLRWRASTTLLCRVNARLRCSCAAVHPRSGRLRAVPQRRKPAWLCGSGSAAGAF
jgi:hypothetical protein